MELTFNKDNWSGETVTINVNETMMSWKQNGYMFRLKLLEETSIDSFECKVYDILGDSWEHPLGRVTYTKMTRLNGKVEEEYNAGDGYIDRDGTNLYEAASKFLFNIV